MSFVPYCKRYKCLMCDSSIWFYKTLSLSLSDQGPVQIFYCAGWIAFLPFYVLSFDGSLWIIFIDYSVHPVLGTPTTVSVANKYNNMYSVHVYSAVITCCFGRDKVNSSSDFFFYDGFSHLKQIPCITHTHFCVITMIKALLVSSSKKKSFNHRTFWPCFAIIQNCS